MINLSNINLEIVNYIGTFLDSRSIFNLMETSSSFYSSIDTLVINAIFQREQKLCSYEDALEFYNMIKERDVYKALNSKIVNLELKYIEYHKGDRGYPYEHRPPGKIQCLGIVAKNLAQMKYKKASLIKKITKLQNQINKFPYYFRNGEAAIMMTLGPKIYQTAPNIEDLPFEDYTFNNLTSSELKHPNQLNKYRSEKHPIVKGQIDGKRFVIIHCTRYRYIKSTSSRKRMLCSISIIQSERDDWILKNGSKYLPRFIFQGSIYQYREKLLQLAHGRAVSFNINDKSLNFTKVEFLLGQQTNCGQS